MSVTANVRLELATTPAPGSAGSIQVVGTLEPRHNYRNPDPSFQFLALPEVGSVVPLRAVLGADTPSASHEFPRAATVQQIEHHPVVSDAEVAPSITVVLRVALGYPDRAGAEAFGSKLSDQLKDRWKPVR